MWGALMSESIIFSRSDVPVFQNKVYRTYDEAKQAITGEIELVQASSSGLVYNRKFKPALVNYDENYQNEQACSRVFQRHLDQVLDIILRNVGPRERGIEIGCGKGYFLERLHAAGADVLGYDPAFEGSSTWVIKKYFTHETVTESPDYLILRHVLEHIYEPWIFLRKLKDICKQGTKIYIEVPCFNWIVQNNAFYDIFYEHINYFTLDVLNRAFSRVIGSGRFFGDQYIYIVADLSTYDDPTGYTGLKFEKLDMSGFLNSLISRKKSTIDNNFVWGAGAKGVTFTNILLDRGLTVKSIIDINPVKQNKFAALSGISIVAPDSVMQKLVGADVFIMNPVYHKEISEMLLGVHSNLIAVV
jgi:SAM-dependent methyltransferase